MKQGFPLYFPEEIKAQQQKQGNNYGCQEVTDSQGLDDGLTIRMAIPKSKSDC